MQRTMWNDGSEFESFLLDPWAAHSVVNAETICNLGGGGGGGSPAPVQTSTTTTKQELSPEQRQLIEAASPALTTFANNPPTDYQGEKIVPFNPLERQAQQMALGAATGPAQQIANQAASTTSFLSGPNLYAASNPYLQSAIEAAIRPQRQTFGETILPGIRNDATTSGQFGGSRQGIAEGIASRGLSDAIAGTTSSMANANYQTGQDSMLKALQYAPLTQQLQFTPASIVGSIGSQQRSMEQAQLDEQIQKYMTSQLLPYLAAKDVAGVAFGFPGGPTTSTSTGPAAQTQANTGTQDALGFGSLGLGLLSLLMAV